MRDSTLFRRKMVTGRELRPLVLLSYRNGYSRSPIKTIVYIDGFNLYFGSLQGTPYRWLDVCALANRLCREQNPACELVLIKYFTADIRAKFSSRGEVSYRAQQDYLLSIQAYGKEQNAQLEVIKGKYNVQPKKFYAYRDPIDFNSKLAVWAPEEKQTDVSIAVHMLCDVMDQPIDQVVIFSNDSDLAPALRVIKMRWHGLKVGIVAPIRGEGRNASADLCEYADWTRRGISDEELAATQLPEKVRTRKRAITRPEHWKVGSNPCGGTIFLRPMTAEPLQVQVKDRFGDCDGVSDGRRADDIRGLRKIRGDKRLALQSFDRPANRLAGGWTAKRQRGRGPSRSRRFHRIHRAVAAAGARA